MNHTDKIARYIELNLNDNLTIERESALKKQTDFILRNLNTYRPETVLKAGLGKGELLNSIAEQSNMVVVVEPNIAVIQKYIKENSTNVHSKKIQFINGDLNSLPIEYYAFKMIICVDYLDFQNTAAVFDEFKRAIDFEGVLLLGGTVLDKNDIDGIYDDLYHMLMPMHNDFYLPTDLTTVLGLKHFSHIQNELFDVTIELKHYSDFTKNYAKEFAFSPGSNTDQFVNQNRTQLASLYDYDGERISEHYLLAIYKSEKPAKIEYEKEVEEYKRKTGRADTTED